MEKRRLTCSGVVGRRSEESQRVPGWFGWSGGGSWLGLEAGLEGGPG